MIHPLFMYELAKAQHEAALREAKRWRRLPRETRSPTPARQRLAAALAVTTLVASILSVMASANGGVDAFLIDAPSAGRSAESARVR